jgi:UDP-N-acetylmuramoyl-tripeptide--D-alanyl-D-alanine ligase
VIAMTLAEIASATGGTLAGQHDPETLVLGQVRTDSREIERDDVFVARRGEENDGHLYAGEAVSRGAALLIVERQLTIDHVESQASSDLPTPVPQIVVADATEALGQFAAATVHRARTHGALKVVGITGSNGKTTTKNLIAAMAARRGPTVANIKSFNNEVGAPLTMLRVAADTETLVAEMGANAEGDIAKLTAMALPDIGVVLTVGLAHVGGFGDLETTFRSKSEMVRDLPTEAVAVLNCDDPWVARMGAHTNARVVWFGQREQADVRAAEVMSDAAGTKFVLQAGGESHPVHFRVLGEHHVTNALAAAAVGLELGLTVVEVAESLEEVSLAAPGRMQVTAGRDSITVINDAYNANPDSMTAALKTLAQVARPDARTIAVLGAMGELGAHSGEAHDRIGLQAVRLGISELVVVGLAARRLHISAINEGSWDGESVFFETREEALDYLLRTIGAGDTVLVKASNSEGLQTLGNELAEALA